MNKFNSDFFVSNRQRLCEVLPNSLVILTAQSLVQKSADTTFPFRQDSSFWYLCGLQQPDLLLVINTKTGESTIVAPEQNDYQKDWDGDINFSDIKQASGVNTVCESAKIDQIIKTARKNKLEICSLDPLPEIVEPYGFYSNPARRVLYEKLKKLNISPKNIKLEIGRLRQIKQPVELEAIQRAIDITADTLSDIKSKLSKFNSEKDIERAITAGFYQRGADGHAYEPIVGSGKNASIIHYMNNNNPVQKNQFVLLDVGAQVDGYAADISRTWIVGKPTNRQKVLHEMILELQDFGFRYLKSGIMLKKYQADMEKHAKKLMAKLGIELDQYPHGFSHFLGLDVHDSGDYDAPLREGSVITVEPGVYLPDENIGIRIEDNVLITKNGIKNLSAHIPRSML